jgi:hypothetical protein
MPATTAEWEALSMSLSNELQIGKAGEHLVCCDLIMQGQNAYLADQGLPYDVLLDRGSKILKIQVKSTQGLSSVKGGILAYRFSLRKTKKGKSYSRETDGVDYFAFVALDIKEVAYMATESLMSTGNNLVQLVEFKSRYQFYAGRIYPNGTIRKPEWGKYFQDYRAIPGGNDDVQF